MKLLKKDKRRLELIRDNLKAGIGFIMDKNTEIWEIKVFVNDYNISEAIYTK